MIDLADFPKLSESALRQWSAPVQEVEIEGLKKLLEHNFPRTGALAVAAPQVGVRKRAFVWNDKGVLRFICNPEILEKDSPIRFVGEGCLSFPGDRRDTRRFNIVRAKYQDHNFEWHEATFTGTDAVVFQHEIGHFDGALFKDFAVKKTTAGRNDPCPCGSGKKFKKCCNV